MNVVPKISVVLAAGADTPEVAAFVHDVRDSLAKSNAQFVALPLVAVTFLLVFHLVVYEGATGLAFQSLQLRSSDLFRKVFLLAPAGVLVAAAAVGYLRRCQREVYDYLCVARSRVLAATGLHELRLPADYLLGLFLLREEGGTLGRAVSSMAAFLAVFVFNMAPVLYIVHASAETVAHYGLEDLLATTAATVASLLAGSSLAIIVLAGRVRAQ